MTNGGHPHTGGPAKKKPAKKGKAKAATGKPRKWTAAAMVPKKA